MSSLRIFLLWAVMLAVPFQGYAAAAMAFCASGHPAAEVSAMSTAMSGQGMTHDHGRGAQVAEAVEAAHDPSHAASTDTGSAHQCGTCGACHAVALIAAFPALESHGPAPTDIAAPAVAIADVASRVPDKPPRA